MASVGKAFVEFFETEPTAYSCCKAPTLFLDSRRQREVDALHTGLIQALGFLILVSLIKMIENIWDLIDLYSRFSTSGNNVTPAVFWIFVVLLFLLECVYAIYAVVFAFAIRKVHEGRWFVGIMVLSALHIGLHFVSLSDCAFDLAECKRGLKDAQDFLFFTLEFFGMLASVIAVYLAWKLRHHWKDAAEDGELIEMT